VTVGVVLTKGRRASRFVQRAAGSCPTNKSSYFSRRKRGKKSRKAAAGQKEMLMPIDGKKPTKETAAKKAAARSQRKSA
jgi:hypothetical protein